MLIVDDSRVLRTRNCETAQAFMIARPMPAEELLGWVKGNRARPKALVSD